MTIEHNAIPDANLHEPKGVAAASNLEVYVADGAASGTWKKLPVASIDTTGGNDGDVFYADGVGAGYWSSAPGGTYGAISIANNATPTVLGTVNTYVKVIAGMSAEHLNGITFTTDHLTIPLSGDYKVDCAITLVGQVNDEFHFATSTDGTVTGIIGGVNVHHSKIGTADATHKYCIPLTYIHNFTANDDIYLIVKNITAAANVTITDMSLTVSLLKEA
jgi:hypothetical protein